MNFERIAAKAFNTKIDFAGAGAAGGLGAGSRTFLQAEMKTGFKFISDFTNLERAIQEAELVITGEGKIDVQTLSGKVVKGVADIAYGSKKRCIAFTGKLDLPANLIKALRIEKIIPLADGHTTESEAITNAFSVLRTRAFTNLKPVIQGN